jgi:D-glycero-beta-D-manno-heptose 1-phosphate adenylyltransferase
MAFLEKIQEKIVDLNSAKLHVNNWKSQGCEIVFTNGCFDLLHFGHLTYLAQARDLGDRLVIGLNSAASVKRLKGAHRPLNDEATRALQMAALAFVDLVIVFEEDTPAQLIEALVPDILVKGGDYTVEQIVGAQTVLENGGEVRTLNFVEGYSTTLLEEKIRQTPKD